MSGSEHYVQTHINEPPYLNSSNFFLLLSNFILLQNLNQQDCLKFFKIGFSFEQNCSKIKKLSLFLNGANVYQEYLTR